MGTDTLQFQKEMQEAFGKYYNKCNYPTTVASELMQVLQNKYGNNMTSFKEEFVKPTQNLLQTLQDNRMPLYIKQDQTFKIIVHLAVSKTVETGEFLFCVGHTKPGTLTLKFCKYVTHLENGTPLAKPMYDIVKMTVKPNSYNECLTLDYLEDLRTTGKLEGTERTSVMLRLCCVKVLSGIPVEGFLKIYDAEEVLPQSKPRQKHAPLAKSHSSPVAVQADNQPLPKPQQVSADASFLSHHPMEEELLPSKITRQPAYEDDSRTVNSDPVVSTNPPMVWQEDPTGMGGGTYVPLNESASYDNFNSQTESGKSSDVAAASKLPLNEWQSQNTVDNVSSYGNSFGFSSLRSTASGNLQGAGFTSSGHEALPGITESLEPLAQNKDKGERLQAATEVRDEYVSQGMGNVELPLTSGGRSPAGGTCSKLAKDVNNGYVDRFQGVGPTGMSVDHLMAGGRSLQPVKDVSNGYASKVESLGPSIAPDASSLVGGSHSKPAKDVDDRYVDKFEGMGPSTTSSPRSQASDSPAKEVSDGYASKVESLGPSIAPDASSLVGGSHSKSAKDVDDRYVDKFEGMGPSTTSSPRSQASDSPAKEVSDGYVSESKGIGPGKCL